LGEFYCFTGIISGYLSDDRELNPLNGKSLSDEDFRRIRMSSHDVKRKKPFLGVRQYVDEDDYEERLTGSSSTTKKSSTRISQNQYLTKHPRLAVSAA